MDNRGKEKTKDKLITNKNRKITLDRKIITIPTTKQIRSRVRFIHPLCVKSRYARVNL